MEVLTQGLRKPHTIYLAVTSNCPHHCPFCSYGLRKKGELSTSQMITLLEEIKKLGTAIIGFTGGEPMIRDDLEELVAATNPEMTSVIFTSGYKLDAARARRFAEANIGGVTIGMEASNPEKHDKVRGRKGSFEEGRAAAKFCIEAGIFTAIGTVATRERIRSGELEKIYEMGRRWGVSEMRVIAPVATGFWTGCVDNMLTLDELEFLKAFHMKHNREGDGPVVASFSYLESAEMFGCNAGFQNLYIDALGNVCPCDLMPLSFGNVTQEPLVDIWKRMEKHFPRPRLTCLMNEIASKIPSDTLPLSPDISSKIMPAIDKNTPLPGIHRRMSKK